MRRIFARLGVAGIIVIVAAVVAVVGVVGTQLVAEGDPKPPVRLIPTPELPDPSVRLSPAPQPSPYVQPESIDVAGTEVGLAPGIVFLPRVSGVGSSAEASGPYRMVQYHSGSGMLSWLTLDEEGRILGSHILAEDLPVFQPLLDAALPQLPTTATIVDKEFTLPPGMSAGQLQRSVNSTDRTWSIAYTSLPAKPKESILWVNQDWEIVRNDVQPEDIPVFQPILDAASAPQ